MSRIQIFDLTISKDNSELESLTNEELKSISGSHGARISVIDFLNLALACLNSFDNVVGHWCASSGSRGFLFAWD